MSLPDIQAWQVWRVQFNPQVGSEQAGVRPAIIVGSRAMCRIVGRRLALVVPCTGTDRGLAWQPRIMLDKPSVVMCEQIKTVSRERLIERLRHEVPDDVREQVRVILENLFAVKKATPPMTPTDPERIAEAVATERIPFGGTAAE